MWQTGAHKIPIYSCHWIAAWKVFFLWEILFRLPQISPLYDDTGYDVRAKFSPSGEVRNGSRRHCRMRGGCKGGMIAGIASILGSQRLGADWYGSTLTCLRRVYPLVADGGLINLDDYYTWDGCTRSLREFLVEASLTEHIRQYDNDVCFVVKRLAAARPPVKTNQDAADSRQVERAS